MSNWSPRQHWGILFASSRRARGILLGEQWDRAIATAIAATHPQRPSRLLLFTTRTAARAWCAQQHASYRDHPVGATVRAWRFRPVRVRESWEVVR